MTDIPNDEIESQLKALIFLMVSKIIEEETSKMEVQSTPMFTASLVDLVFNQLLNLGEDLELFAHHAGRNTIKQDDIYMVVRKNEVLANILKEYEHMLS